MATLLVVDDDEQVRELLRKSLPSDLTAVEAADGAQTAAAAPWSHPQVVIMDLERARAAEFSCFVRKEVGTRSFTEKIVRLSRDAPAGTQPTSAPTPPAGPPTASAPPEPATKKPQKTPQQRRKARQGVGSVALRMHRPAAIALFLAWTVPLVPAHASGPEPATPADFVPSSAKSVALFLGGAATAFVAHESCHVAANLALGLVPHVKPVQFMGAIPFFSISPPVTCDGAGCHRDDGSPFGPGRPGLYSIIASGLQCQQLANEVILSTEPQLLHREAPFRKGVLAFNLVLSVGYAFADWTGVEPESGDLASLERLTGVPRGAIAAAVFIPAVLDLVRLLFPDTSWLPWAARVSKGAIFGFLFAF